MLPNGAAGYHPYDATHVITQFEILLFSALAFTILNLRGKYPTEIPSVNLDIDWVYRKVGRSFLLSMSVFWNGLNKYIHSLIVVDLISKVGVFTKVGHIQIISFVSEQINKLGFSSTSSSVLPKNKVEKRKSRNSSRWVNCCDCTFVCGRISLGGFFLNRFLHQISCLGRR